MLIKSKITKENKQYTHLYIDALTIFTRHCGRTKTIDDMNKFKSPLWTNRNNSYSPSNKNT
jgi:hypothetical protein